MQQQLMRQLLAKFPQLEPDDITSRSMGANGSDLLLSPAARKLIPYDFECKSLARFVGHSYIEQAVSNCPKNATPVAVVKANHKKPVVIMYIDDWIKNGVDKDIIINSLKDAIKTIIEINLSI